MTSEAQPYAHVSDGQVVNVSLWDGVTNVPRPEGITLVPLPHTEREDGTRVYTGGVGWSYSDTDGFRPPSPGDGWTWDGQAWVAPPPTPEQIEKQRQKVERARHAAYQRDADPAFFRWQRGTATEQEWLDAVQAVKDAHPYPEPL